MNSLTKLLIWVGIVVAAFAFAWWKGYLLQVSNYVRETREELRKCSWPTWEELKDSTVLITICLVMLGAFTYLADEIFIHLMFWISKA